MILWSPEIDRRGVDIMCEGEGFTVTLDIPLLLLLPFACCFAKAVLTIQQY